MDAREGKRKWRVTSGEWRVRRKSRFVAALGMTTSGNMGIGGNRNDSVYVVDAAAAEVEMVVEEEGAGGLAGLDG